MGAGCLKQHMLVLVVGALGHGLQVWPWPRVVSVAVGAFGRVFGAALAAFACRLESRGGLRAAAVAGDK